MSNVRLDLYSVKEFQPGSFWKRLLWYFTSRIFFKTLIPYPSFFKVWVLKLFGANVGKGVVVKPQIQIKYPWNLVIGNHTWIGEGVWIDNLDSVQIGSQCCISQGAMLLCGNHDFTSSTFDLNTKPILLEYGVWIGAKCIIAPGVKCAKNSVLSAGLFTSKSLEENTIYSQSMIFNTKPRIIKQQLDNPEIPK